MDINKQRMLMKGFFVSSQFSYFPLIWTFHSGKMGHWINSIHKRGLKLVYQDSHYITLQKLLAKEKIFNAHQKKP